MTYIGRQKNYFCTILLLIFIPISYGMADSFQLKSDGKVFPFYVNLPHKPESGAMPHPYLDDSKIYFFNVTEPDNSIGYSVVVADLSKHFSDIEKELAIEMINISINTQIDTIDQQFGVEGKITNKRTELYFGHPSVYLEIVRYINSYNLLGFYRSIFFKGYLVTVFANTIDADDNSTKAKSFVKSLEIKTND